MHKLIGLFYKFLYKLDLLYLIEVRLRTWLMWGLAIFAVLMLLVRLPGSLWLSGVSVGVILILALGSRWARGRDYIHFVPAQPAAPAPAPAPISLDETVLHHASGPFAVEDKTGRWSHLIARYRTFRDREHVIMARLTPTNLWGVGAPDVEMLGMWYFFIRGEHIIELTPGDIYWGAAVEPGLKLRFQKKDAQGKRIRGVFYLHFHSLADRQQVWADLQQDL